MPNKYLLFLTLIILFSCSKDKSVDLTNAVNIFQPKKTISFVNNQQEGNSKLDILIDSKEILNSKSYNLNNSKINYPFKKKWQIEL